MANNRYDHIKENINIVDVIDHFVPLKKNGKDYAAKCCFHDEKTESFTVSEKKQMFHCFGCGAHGDVFDFLMKYHGYRMGEAAEYLIHEYRIEVPEHLKWKKNGNKSNEDRNNLIKRIAAYAASCKNSPTGIELLAGSDISPALRDLEVGVINDPERIKAAVINDNKLLASAKACHLIDGDKISLAKGPVFIQRNAKSDIQAILGFDGRLLSNENLTPFIVSKSAVTEMDVYFDWTDFIQNATENSAYIANYFSDLSNKELARLRAMSDEINFIISKAEQNELMLKLVSIYKDGDLFKINDQPLLSMTVEYVIDKTHQAINKASSGFNLAKVLLSSYKKLEFTEDAPIAHTLLIDPIAKHFGVKAEMLLNYVENSIKEEEKQEAQSVAEAINVAKINQIRGMF